MKVEELFAEIRKGDFALWIGAGFSQYAGYPSSMQLKTKIYEKCLEFQDIEKGILQSMTLELISETFIRLNDDSREPINDIIKENFSKEPINTVYHDVLSSIPYFKNIITTNYDFLLENSFGNRAVVIRQDSDLIQTTKNIPRIFKLHGDIQVPDKIIIAKDDYLVQKHFDNPIWTEIKHVIATSNILFIGYGFEDSNIRDLFSRVESRLGESTKLKAFITPNVSKINKAHYEKKGFRFFTFTGQQFIKKLDKNISDNILKDVQNNTIDTDTYFKYLKYKDLSSSVNSRKERVQVIGVTNANGETKIDVKLTLPRQKAIEFIEFNNGESDNVEFNINSNDLLNFSTKVFGLNGPIFQEDISDMLIKRVPTAVDIEVESKKQKINFSRITGELYTFQKKVKLLFKLADIEFTIFLNTESLGGTYKFTVGETVSTVQENLNSLKIVQGYINGEAVDIYVNNKVQAFKPGICAVESKDFLLYVKSLSQILRKLKTIEEVLHLRFRNIPLTALVPSTINLINVIYEVSKKGFFLEENVDKAIRFDRSQFTKEGTAKIKHIKFKKGSFVAIIKDTPTYELFGHKIDLGLMVIEFLNAELFKNNQNQEFIKSSTGDLIYRFVKMDRHLIGKTLIDRNE